MGKSTKERDSDPFTTASAQARIDSVEAKVDGALQSGIEAGNKICTNKLFGIAPDEASMEQLTQAITVAIEGLKDAKKIKGRLKKNN